MLISLLLYFSFLQPTRSVPTSIPGATQEFVSWKGEPETRGSFSLLSNCIITLTLCVWTAVHLNITIERQPGQNWSFAQRLKHKYAVRRLLWVLMGLAAPELVVFTAWMQYSSARELTKEMNRILSNQAEDTGAAAPNEWTMVHSFYAGMGGFSIAPSGIHKYLSNSQSTSHAEAYIPESCGHLTLTAQGVLFLASKGFQIPPISRQTILDRSKSDGLAKLLVCCQAGYMIIQCAARVASKLPISPLEINTLGHVFCALVMYSFWLHKPQDVHTCTVISDDTIRPVCAYMFMGSSLSQAVDGSKREFSKLHYGKSENTRPTQDSELSKFLLLPSPKSLPSTITSLKEGQALDGTELGPKRGIGHLMTKAEQKEIKYHRTGTLRKLPLVYRPSIVHLDKVDVARWRLASSFIASGVYPLDVFETSSLDLEYFVNEVPNWPLRAGYISKSFYSIWASIAVVVGLYGALHALAWNEHFPSTVEQLLWRSSSILVAISGSLAFILILVDRLPSFGKESYIKWWFGAIQGQPKHDVSALRSLWLTFEVALGFIILLACVAPLTVGILAYIPARLYLVVEAFISLRELPLDMYKTPIWTQLIPHL